MTISKRNSGLIKAAIIIASITILVVSRYFFLPEEPQTYEMAGEDSQAYDSIEPDLSSDRSLQDSERSITIDFKTCTPDKRRFNVAFGSTTVAVIAKNSDLCRIAYGGEVENPNWDGSLGFNCNVPTDLGVKEFIKRSMGVNLSPIESYCSGPSL